MSPLTRVLRTIGQVLLAEAVAIPAAAAGVGLDAGTTARVSAYCGAVVVLVTAAQNGLEQVTGRTIGGGGTGLPASGPSAPTDLEPMA